MSNGTLRNPSHCEPPPGSGIPVDSFFDVFVELSVDGGSTWSEGEQPAHFRLTQEQPTPVRIATWGTMKALYR